MRDTKASGTHAGGVCSLLATSAASSLLPSLVPSTPTHLPAVRGALLGAGMRFLAFDLFRDASRDWAPGMHSALRGGLAGCVGGLAETVQSALLATLSARSADPLRARTLGPALVSHGTTLFLCFGGYTALSTGLYDAQPPPVPATFGLGGLAGAVGVPLATLLVKRGKVGVKSVAGLAVTGFVRVGTVIGVQVSSAPRVLDYLEERRLARP